MFIAYIDDAGTAPDQKVALATSLIIPACKLKPFESEWRTFIDKWGISDFHTAECAAANPKKGFGGWDQVKIGQIFGRVRQIARKYGVKSYSLCVNKNQYDSIIPTSNRPTFGYYHYTYAVHNLLSFLDNYACQTGIEHQVQFVFDWIDKTHKSQKNEIEEAIARSEAARPGRFGSHYSFRKREDTPGLQCVDIIGWTC